MLEHDARSAALDDRPDYVYLEWKGHRYELRPPSIEFLDRTQQSKESEIQKTVRMIMQCTYWPPEAVAGSDGKARAGTLMFEKTDFPVICSRAHTPGTFWHALALKVQEVVQGPKTEAEAKALVESVKGNSDASLGNDLS